MELKRVKYLVLISLTIFICGFPTFLSGQENIENKVRLTESESVLFGPEEVLSLEIVLDMKAIFRKKKADEYTSATFSILSENGILAREIGVKLRGNYRKSYCAIPPLKLKFKGADFGYEGWDGLKSIKLVTTCKNSNTFDQYLVKEYLAYKMYNVLTPKSFQVRMARITFRDKSDRYDPVEQMAFFIEDIDDLAERNDAFELEPDRMTEAWADTELANLMAVFEYAIGNTDWHIGNLHNMKVIKSNDPIAGTSYLIPYDFDFSGFVNTHYALPNDVHMIPDVKTRLFLGTCNSRGEIASAIMKVKTAQAEWNNIIASCPWLEEDTRRECLKYMEEFSRILESPRRMELVFFQECDRLAER